MVIKGTFWSLADWPGHFLPAHLSFKGPRKQQVASSSDSGSLIVHGKGAV